ncbi:MAG TPA: hypothetical protein VEV17_21170 [Bryobacteraceae bacterium]|nr:hypothetical protein [Bryobacteraceae bacterium]
MTRRRMLFAASVSVLSIPAFAATVPGISIRGKLTRSSDGKPALEVSPGKLISLQGDEDTAKVLNDSRLAGADLEAIGHFESPDHFQVDPITSRALFVHKDNQRLLITYWCDVCYIRTYSPGNCVCCQKYTDLDLREHDEP